MKVLCFTLALISLGFWKFRSVEEPIPEPIPPALAKEIEYGKELFAHTARYLGPKGSVAQHMGTRMNCQNCHLDAGAKPYGIGLNSVHARYPDYRAREGKVLTLLDRINNCIERPMNGKPLHAETREARALLAYFRFLSQGKTVGIRAKGDRLNDLVKFPSRAADPAKGQAVFKAQCVQCHGEDGQGKLHADGVEFEYPPLWGEESFNEASNMHRNIKLAAFIKANMPFGATWDKPILSDEEAFDVAAFINQPSHHRPKTKWKDYPNIAEKPIDFPSGPYADSWTEERHRLGPYLPIIEAAKTEGKVAYY